WCASLPRGSTSVRRHRTASSLFTSATSQIVSAIRCTVIKISPQTARRILSLVNEEQREKLLAAVAVLCVEARRQGAIEIKHAHDVAILYPRHDQFGARERVARNVSGKIVDIGHQHRCAARCRSPANPFADRDSRAGRLALERAEHKLRVVA